jgi:hypothetical protein
MKKQRNFKVICISIFKDDLETLDELVAQSRKHKIPRTSRSSLLRAMIRNVKPEELRDWARNLKPSESSNED